MVGLGGLEPPTSPLSGVRSNHLSYRPVTHRSYRLALTPDFTEGIKQFVWALMSIALFL